jgi:hypothetical protein
MLAGEIKDLQAKGKVKAASEKDIQEYTEKLASLKIKQANAQESLLKVLSTLKAYQAYCKQITRIVEELELNKSENSSERQIFNQFLSNILS